MAFPYAALYNGAPLLDIPFPMRLPALLTACLLVACTARFDAADLPALAANDIRTFRLDRLHSDGSVAQSSILVVQGESDGRTRWIQTDALGAPQARLLATPQGWQSDGFAPPNREAERLFIALFPLIKQNTVQHLNGWRLTPLDSP